MQLPYAELMGCDICSWSKSRLKNIMRDYGKLRMEGTPRPPLCGCARRGLCAIFPAIVKWTGAEVFPAKGSSAVSPESVTVWSLLGP